MALKPATAVRIEQGAMNEVAIDLLAIGDLLLVRPGELIPADGKVCRGESAVNQASITGESLPVEKTAGSEVFAGTVNGEGPLYIEVTKAAENTLFAKIIKMVEEAESEVPDSQRFIKRLESIYARVVVAATVALIALPPYLLDWSWSDTFIKRWSFWWWLHRVRWSHPSCLPCCRPFPKVRAKASCSKVACTWRIWRGRPWLLLTRPER